MGVRLSSKQSTASASAVSSTVITTTTSVSAPVISQIYYTDSSYNNTASTLILSTGGYIKIIGTGFEAGSVVYVGGQTSNVIEKTFVSSTEIRIQVGALISATYSLMVFNTNNTGAIYANGVVSSSVPNWTIPAGSIATVYETIAVNNLVTAPSDSAVTYSITGGALPLGVLLNSVTGSLSGTAPTVANQTIYNFTVTAIDAELQTTSREYSYTINPDVVTWSSPVNGLTTTVYEHTAISNITLVAPSAAGKAVSYSANALPTGVSLSSNIISGTPTIVGSTTTALTATAATTNRTANRNINFVVNQDVVTWNSPAAGATLTGAQDTAYTQALSATSAAGKTISYSANALPAGLSISGSSITGTPSAASSISSLITATAATTNRTATRTFNWNITSVAGVYTWGWNGNSGQLGLGDRDNRSVPTQMSATNPYSVISDGVAIKPNGTLWSWGTGYGGRLGLGDTIARSSPVQVGALTNWLKVSASKYNSLAIKTNGTLWAWGVGFYGNLGLGDIGGSANYRSSPMQVGALTNWAAVSSGDGFASLAVKTDGTLWSWGTSSNGMLGLGTITNRSIPVQVGTLTNWKTPLSGQAGGAAIKTDGTLWTWGSNAHGTLGLGDTSSRSSPVQVGTLTTWSVFGAGNLHYMAAKTDGTLWVWGNNNNGQLGLNNITSYSSPKQLGALTNWARSIVSGGINHSVLVKTNGTLWSWGINSYSVLGLNDTIKRSSPVQVGTTATWQTVNTLNQFSVIAVAT